MHLRIVLIQRILIGLVLRLDPELNEVQRRIRIHKIHNTAASQYFVVDRIQ